MDTVRNTYKINDNSDLGDVHISDDVLAVISAMANFGGRRCYRNGRKYYFRNR